MLTDKHKHPIFLKSLFGVMTILSFGLYLVARGQKEKKDFIHSKGQVVYYADNHPEISRPRGKHKYLVIESYNRLFELYVPEEQTEKYTFNYNDIKLGDVIDIYFDENSFASDKRTNRSMKFIDINGKNIFISNPNDKTAGICFIGVGISIIVLLIVLKQKGKII
jgi:hypothetical protein